MKKIFLTVLVFFGATALMRTMNFSYQPLTHFTSLGITLTVGAVFAMVAAVLAFKSVK